MAYVSRSLELVGWLRCGLGLALLAVWIWWQDSSPVRERCLGISDNKAVFLSSSPLVALHAAGGSSEPCFFKFPWRRMKEEVAGTGSLNKCAHRRSSGADAAIFLLAGHGGKGEEDSSLMRVGFCRWLGSSHPMVLCRPSIYAVERH